MTWLKKMEKALLLSIFVVTAPVSNAQSVYEFKFEDELTLEETAMLVSFLDGNSVEAAMLRGLQDSTDIADLLENRFLTPTGQPTWAAEAWSGAGSAILSISNAQSEQWYSELNPERRLQYSATGNQPFIFVEPNSNFGQLVGEFEWQSVRSPIESLAIPIPTEDFVRYLSLQDAASIRPIAPTNYFFPTSNLQIAESINDGLRDFGSVSIDLVSNSRLSDEERNAILTELRESGVVVELLSQQERGLVSMDLDPSIAVIQQSGGSCSGESGESRPEVLQIHKILSFNAELMELAQGLQPIRTEVLIVDNGLSEHLAVDGVLGTFHRPRNSLSLARGFSWSNGPQAPVVCSSKAAQNGETAYGLLANVGFAQCPSMLPVGGLTPLPLVANEREYLAAHGGMVASLVAGGPELMASTLELNRNIGLLHANIYWEQNGLIMAGPTEVNRALQYARSRSVPIVNMSLSVRPTSSKGILNELDSYLESGGVIVAAAGNNGGYLLDSSTSFPASAASGIVGDNRRQIIVVGGVEYDESSGFHYSAWEQSNYSPVAVDILAPAAGVASFGSDGSTVCANGTSFAAPQVSFVVAMLISTVDMDGVSARQRLLDTATEIPDLIGRSTNGRVLDSSAALDIFVDLIWLHGEAEPIRVRIHDESFSESPVSLKFCAPIVVEDDLYGSGGYLDLNQVQVWRAGENEVAEIRAENVSGQIICEFDPEAELNIIRIGSDVQEKLEMGEIARIVPSRYRLGFAYQ